MQEKETYSERQERAENPDATTENKGLNAEECPENQGSFALTDNGSSEKNIRTEQAEKRMQETPAFQKAKDSKKKGESAAYKSRMRALSSMQGFFAEVHARKKSSGWKTKLFDDPERLENDCNEFLAYCLEHEIVPTWNLFAVWVDCSVQTLYAEESISSECSDILKKLRNRLFTILEQFSLQTEGNPASPIFHEKAQYGLSDQQPLDINLHTDTPRQASAEEFQDLIEATPAEPSKYSLPGE